METLSVLKLMPENASQITTFSESIISACEDGEINALDLYKLISSAEKSLKIIKDRVKDQAFEEAEKYGKSFQHGYCNVKLSTRTDYDFSVCNDEVYNSLNTKLNEAKKGIKDREKYLKAVKDPISTIDQESGEILEIIPPAKTFTDVISISFADRVEDQSHELDPSKHNDLAF